MTCTRIGNAIVCTNPWGRLHVGNRYVWVDFHPYCGPLFSYDQAGNKPYEPKGVRDPVWKEFKKWFKKYEASKAKKAKK